jgi:hypothetical protein
MPNTVSNIRWQFDETSFTPSKQNSAANISLIANNDFTDHPFPQITISHQQ